MPVTTTHLLTMMGIISGLTNYLVTAGIKFPTTKSEIGSFILSLSLLVMGYFAQGIQGKIREQGQDSLLNTLPNSTASPQEVAQFLEKFSLVFKNTSPKPPSS